MGYLGTKPANAVVTSEQIADGVITPNDLAQSSDFTFNGVKVGKGGGAVSTNTAVGASALIATATGTNNTAIGNTAMGASAVSGSANTAIGSRSAYSLTSGNYNSAIGEEALYSNTTGSNNTAVGFAALVLNTTASNNTAVGYQAGYSVVSGSYNTFIGNQAGYLAAPTGTALNVAVGHQAGYNLTGTANTLLGNGSGSSITSGTKNSVLGSYNGNQGGLDIRTANNYIVLSDGDGNPRLYFNYTSSSNGFWISTSQAAADSTNAIFNIRNASGGDAQFEAGNSSLVGISSVLRLSKQTGNNRSISAAGTINANGSDYAEYMVKSGDFTINKGDIVGINSQGQLTNVYADAISFCVKSTNPSYVGGDDWHIGPMPTDKNGNELSKDSQEHKEWALKLEAARQTVDRIAFCGQVPVNVTGATAGQYIIPINDNGSIKGEAVSNPTFEQYQIAIGKVIAIEADGRAKIIVKVA